MPGLDFLALAVASLGTTTFAANALYLGTYALFIGGPCEEVAHRPRKSA
jgi:hypothetical protein